MKKRKVPKQLKSDLTASSMPDGSIVIQGTLPDGKYLVLEVCGKKVKVAFFGASAEPLW